MEFTGDFGAIGAGLALGIGVATGTPERPQVVIEGDGSFFQHLQELETVVRERLQLIVIIMNDAGYGAEVFKMRAKGFDSTLAQWDSPDFVAVSRALGGDGVRLQSETEIGDALNIGLKQGGLYLIDALPPTDKKKTESRKTEADNFTEKYPNITGWIKDSWIEIGRNGYSTSIIRVLDEGGLVWEGGTRYRSIDEILQEAENAIADWTENN